MSPYFFKLILMGQSAGNDIIRLEQKILEVASRTPINNRKWKWGESESKSGVVANLTLINHTADLGAE